MRKIVIKIIGYVLVFIFAYNFKVSAETMLIDGMYKIEEGIVCDILQNTTIADFKSHVNLADNDNVYLDDVKQKEDTVIGTGMLLKTEDEQEYILSVKGDISGDGKSTQTDLLQQKRGIIGLKTLEQHEKYAVDINNDGKVTGTDLLQFKQFLVNLTNSIVKEKYIAMDNSATVDLSSKSNRLQLTAKAIPGTAGAKLKWTTSDSSIIEVNQEGQITAKKHGKATITVTSTNGKTAKCEVEVQTTPTNILLNISSKTLNLSEEKEIQLVPTIEPATANAKTGIKYTSSNTSVATVDSSGKVTAIATGTATITATTENGKTATVTINVEEEFKDFTISLADGYADYNYITEEMICLFYENNSSKKLDNGKTKKPSTLQLVITADNGLTPENITYESSNTNIFTVSETGELNATAKPSAAYTTTVRANDATLTISCGSITKTIKVRVSCSSSIVEVSCDNGGWTNGTTTNKGSGHFQRCITCYQCHRFHTLKTGANVSNTRTDDKVISCSLCGGWISLD